MEKSINVLLNQFDSTPATLCADPVTGAPVEDISFDLASLYHHYYFDKHKKAPPNPDPAQFEHLQYLTPENHFRVLGEGLGYTTAGRRTMSSELGHAFCRKFLHDHADIIYFAHIEHMVKRSLHPGFGGLTVSRAPVKGDAPDYFCAERFNRVYLAEAKGSHEPIGFQNKLFKEWRDQFARVIVKDGAGIERTMKGFIVATRFATEAKPYTKSCIYAEDPESPGERPLSPDQTPDLGNAIIAMHYSDIASKLDQPILSEALLRGFRTPAEIQFLGTVWELQLGPFAGRRYIGGYYPSGDGDVRFVEHEGKISFLPINPFRLDVGRATFLGLEEKIFKQLVDVARGGPRLASEISRPDEITPFYSAISSLKDGSILGPLDFFNPVEQVRL